MSIKKLLQNQKGFSLIELLIVIGILAILAVIIIPRFADTGEDSREAADDANVKLLQSAVERYHFEEQEYPIDGTPTNGTDATTLNDSGTIDQDELVTAGYISEPAINPWTDAVGAYTLNDGIVQSLDPTP